MSIKLNSVGGGSVTIQEPNTASDFTLSVPAQTANLLTNRTAGTVLQVASTTKTDTFSTTSNSFVDITGLSVSITPTFSTSRIMVFAVVTASTTGQNNAMIRLVRDSTAIAVGNADGSRVQGSSQGRIPDELANLNLSVNFLDSPATTSSVTYKVQFDMQTSGTGFVNRLANNVDNSDFARTVSSITVMEIAA
jgi:hypothetical protein